MKSPSLCVSDPPAPIAPTYFPHDINLLIAQELYNDSAPPDSAENAVDLVSLSMSSKSWRCASLPFLYYHCSIGGRGNFAIENWLARLLPRYGHFTKSIDVALCWTHTNKLPEREREFMGLDQSGLTNPWENARGGLIAQLISSLPNLSTMKLTMLQCNAVYEPGECSCSTRDSTFQTLELLEAHAFERLTIVVTPTVKPNLLLDALSKGAFPGLKQIEIDFNPKGHWSSARWDSNMRAAVQTICDERRITLTIAEDKYLKESLAKVRVRRRVRPQL
ncbi:unnamed protein product [Rhizoctonia solani]|uniref:Uncharacterized protein n=1 Tax=Rhizoctonia solani TaxID=456999 RepID=A0A8H3DIS1_9AGAM|nr:unnamed protein product [Rhizoctonia solani]